MSKLTTFARSAAVAAVAALASAALPAAAGAAATGPVCSPQLTAQVFAPFGDLRDYYLAPGGSFEGGITWAQSGAVSLAATNEPFYLAGATDTSSARLRAGGKLTSPRLCVSRDEPFMRFVARSVATSGSLDVTVRVYDAYGRLTDSSSGGIGPDAHATWAPSRLVDLKTDSFAVGQTGYVDIVFRSQGDWQIDDVFIDPYRR